jgi:hypothetical protein
MTNINVVMPEDRKARVFETRVDGDQFPRLVILGDGTIFFGDGTVPPAESVANGVPGTDGKSVRSGNVIPNNADGVDGDFYIDYLAWLVYGPKTGGAWGLGTSMIGPTGADGPEGQQGDDGPQGISGADGADGVDGADGATIMYQSGLPDSSDGNVGDFYLESVDYVLYGPKGTSLGSEWTEFNAGVSLIGPPGADGADGADGDLTLAGLYAALTSVDESIVITDNTTTLDLSAVGGGGGLTEEQVQDAVAALLVAGTNIQDITYADGAVPPTLTINAATQAGGTAGLFPYAAHVYQLGGNTIAKDRSGNTISSLATTAANNTTVINAAIDAIDGTRNVGTLTTQGHAGGGTVLLADRNWEISGAIILKYGVSLEGAGRAFDRAGLVASGHSFSGCTICPTSALPSIDINAGAGTTTKRPAILVGFSTGGSGTQSTTNPHGVSIRNINIDLRRITTAQGLLIADAQFVYVNQCNIANARGVGGRAIEIVSTNTPDDGAHGINITDCMLANCEIGLDANGSGSTDSLISNCRVLQ